MNFKWFDQLNKDKNNLLNDTVMINANCYNDIHIGKNDTCLTTEMMIKLLVENTRNFAKSESKGVDRKHRVTVYICILLILIF